MARRVGNYPDPCIFEAGAVLEPLAHPERYRLVEELSSPRNHPVLKEVDAPTVWTAVDTSTGELVAVKVIPTDIEIEDFRDEGLVLSMIRDSPHSKGEAGSSVSHPGREFCVRIKDSFRLGWMKHGVYTAGEQGWEEQAVVLELEGPSLAKWLQSRPSPFLPPSLTRRIVRQVLQALSCLTTFPAGGIVHGSLSPANILLQHANALTQEASTFDFESTLSVRLAGFSHAVARGENGGVEPGDWLTAAPEQLLNVRQYGSALGTAGDVWSLGAVASILLFGKNISIYDTHSIWKSQIPLGALYPDERFPEILMHDWSCSPRRYAGDPLKFPPLRQRIEAEGKVTDPEEVDSLFSFLKACWTLDPEKRPSAKELLEHEWLRRVE